MKLFSCWFINSVEVEEPVKLFLYDTNKDSLYSLKKRIDNKEIETPDESDLNYLKANETILKEYKKDKFYRYILLMKMYLHIDYDAEMKERLNQIETLRYDLDMKLKMLPMYFQQTSYINTKEKLENIILNFIHIDNVMLLIDLL